MGTRFWRIAVAASLALSLPAIAVAGEAEDKIIARVEQAYGVGKLKSINIYTDYRVTGGGQGYTPEYSEHTQMVYEIKLDLINKRGSSEIWGGPHANYNDRSFNTADGTIDIDYVHKTYDRDADGTYYGTVGGAIRRSDTLLAFELVNSPDEAVVKETTNYNGTPHTVVTLSLPGWTPMDIYVDNRTGYISKMDRPSRIGRLYFQFGDFRKKSGVTYARDYALYVDDFLSEFTKTRKVKINNVSRRTFKMNRGLTPQRKKMDRSEMTVEAVGDQVVYVGQGIGYTAFIDAGSHIIGVGATAGLADRLEAYKKHVGREGKPLRYFVVTHHHEDHLRGLKDVNTTGLTYITPEIAAERVRDAIGEPISEGRVRILSDRLVLGPVDIHTISTSHVKEFALVYIPKSKIVIQVDHFGALFSEGQGNANRDTVSLKSEIDRLGLKVDHVISLHNRKVQTWNDFSDAVAAYNPDPCPTKRKICR